MSVCRRKKDGKIFVNYTKKDGKAGRKFFTGPTAMEEAVAWNAAHVQPQTAKAPSRGPVFAELVSAYMELKQSSISTDDFNNMGLKMRGVILPVMGHLTAEKMTFAVFDRYIINRSKLVGMSTLNRDFCYIRAVLNWSVRRRLIPVSPLTGYDIPKKDHKVVQELNQEDIEKVILHASDHLKRAILLSFFLGLRPGAKELLSIKYAQINWTANTLTVISAKKRGMPQREVPIHPSLPVREWYEADGSNDENFIITWNGKPIERLKTGWTAAKRRAGFNPKSSMRMYSLRHSFISILLRNKVDVYTVSQMSGNDPQTILAHYAHTCRDTKISAVNQLPTLELTKKEMEGE